MRADHVGRTAMRGHRGSAPRRMALVATVLLASMGLGVFAAGAAVPWLAAIGDTTPVEPDVACATEADDAADAAELAEACGHDVEVLEERTEWDTVYAQPDGNTRLESSIAALRTDVTGDWAPIDTTLVPGDDGYVVASAVAPMTFSDGSDGSPLATIERDGHVVTMDVPFDLPAPRAAGRSLEYLEVLPDVDLIVTVHEDGTGFSEVLRVATPEAAAHPDLAELVLPVEVSSHTRLVPADGGFAAVDAAGEQVLTSPAPLMWDSTAGDTAPPLRPPVPQAQTAQLESEGWRVPGAPGAPERPFAPVHGDQVAVMDLELRSDDVAVIPDAEMLTDPQTQWPVYIDPSLSANRHRWTAVRDTLNTDYKFSTDQGVGYCNSTAMNCSRLFKSRLMWEFTGLGTIGGLASGDIVSATFSAYGTHSYSCAASTVGAFRVDSFTSDTGWSGGPWSRPQGTRYVAHKPACSSSPARWVDFDVSSAARWVAINGRNSVAIGLKASDESTMAGWKRYRYDARLSVVYNRAPSTPTSLAVIGTTPAITACTAGSTPPWLRPGQTSRLSATLADPDGDSVRGIFELYEGGSRRWTATSAAQASGATHSVTIPDSFAWKDGATYEWRVQGRDTSNRTGPVKSCEFRVDLTNPEPPLVTPVEGHEAVYHEDVTSPAMGVEGRFTIRSGGSTDDAKYEAWFNGIPPDPNDPENQGDTFVVTSPGQDFEIPYTPHFAGEHVLHVRAIDHAGNASSETTYSFGASANEPIIWRFDEGTGQVAEDAAGRFPLSLGSATTWTPGPSNLPGGDNAVLTGAASGMVHSPTGPLLGTGSSFTVSAIVRLDNRGSTATAVSQSNADGSAFELGFVKDSTCPDGCWAFQLAPGTTGDPVIARSTAPVETGQWYLLAGSHDAGRNRMQLHVCAAGTREHTDPPVSITVSESPLGAFHVGGAGSIDNPAHRWPGAISEVRLFHGGADLTQIRLACTPAS